MKKISMMILVLGLMAFGAFGGDIQQDSVTSAAISTNSATVSLDVVGEIKLLTLDLLTSDAVSVTVTEQYTGAVIYQNTNMTADVTLVPVLQMTDSAGAGVTFINDTATNKLYAPVICTGINITTVAGSATTNTVTAKAEVDKNP